MLESIQQLAVYLVPVFVVLTMLNVGLTQTLADIGEYWKEWRFVAIMLLANFVLAPAVMVALLALIDLPIAYEVGLLVFSLCAGAPFLIKLTQTSGHDLALGAAVMLLLMVATVVYAPLVLPQVIDGASVDAWAVAKALALQLLLPIAVGMLAMRWLPALVKPLQPWVARLGTWALYGVIVTTLVGHVRALVPIVTTGAVVPGLLFVLVAFAIGYGGGKLSSGGADHLEDIGGLGTAQRNTAAGMIIATQNFEDPDVMVMLTLANVLGIVMLLLIARRLSRDNEVALSDLVDNHDAPDSPIRSRTHDP